MYEPDLGKENVSVTFYEKPTQKPKKSRVPARAWRPSDHGGCSREYLPALQTIKGCIYKINLTVYLNDQEYFEHESPTNTSNKVGGNREHMLTNHHHEHNWLREYGGKTWRGNAAIKAQV